MHDMTLFSTDQQLQDLYEPAAVIYPFPPTTPVLKSSRKRKESPLTPVPDFQRAVGVSNPGVTEPAGGGQTIDPQQPVTEREGVEHGETSTLGDDNRYRAVQAQIQLLMQRMERMEAGEEAPPEYVSAYGSSR
ncbi:hypothetical protein PQX77_012475 [Marasmius sp. AFHP31]|nr:hypothetical protein PQX77_012475 [Marasmius sp. AFHP31]